MKLGSQGALISRSAWSVLCKTPSTVLRAYAASVDSSMWLRGPLLKDCLSLDQKWGIFCGNP